MRPLPKDLKLIREIGRLLDNHISSQKTYVEIRSTDLYDIVKRSDKLYEEFPTPRIFNQFLRKAHKDKILGSFIAYRVDETKFEHFEWHFRKKN